MSEREPDEFDRIVEGLAFEGPEESEFLSLENDDFAEPALAGEVDAIDDDASAGSPDDQTPGDLLDDDLPDFVEVTYREAPPVKDTGDLWRPRGWIALAALPFVLMAFSAAGIYISPTFIGMVIVAAVALLGYLLWTNPNRQSGDSSQDGSSV